MGLILLTSKEKFLIENDLSFLPKPIDEMKIALINTASKMSADTAYLDWLEWYKGIMTERNWDFEEIDIDGKTEAELRKILSNKDLIHIEGGNAFYLLKCVRESGFDKIIKDLLDRGVVYVGSSAGSYLMCPTVEVAAWKESRDKFGVTDFTALNMVPFLIKAHYKLGQDDILREKISTASCPVRILTDDQAFLVKDGKAELIGEGEEIKL